MTCFACIKHGHLKGICTLKPATSLCTDTRLVHSMKKVRHGVLGTYHDHDSRFSNECLVYQSYCEEPGIGAMVYQALMTQVLCGVIGIPLLRFQVIHGVICTYHDSGSRFYMVFLVFIP